MKKPSTFGAPAKAGREEGITNVSSVRQMFGGLRVLSVV